MGFRPARRLISTAALGLIFVAICAIAEITPPNPSRLSFTNIVPGLGYAHLRNTTVPWSHIAGRDRAHRELRIITILARQPINSLASMSGQVAELSASLGRPLACLIAILIALLFPADESTVHQKKFWPI
jgi:hypothetical protein